MRFLRFITKHAFEVSCVLWLIVILILLIFHLFTGIEITF